MAVSKITSGVPIIEKRFLPNGTGYITRWADGRTEYRMLYGQSNVTPLLWTGGIYYYDLNISIPSGVFGDAPNLAFATPRNNQWWVVGCSIGSATSGQIRVARPSSSAADVLVSAIFEGNSPA